MGCKTNTGRQSQIPCEQFAWNLSQQKSDCFNVHLKSATSGFADIGEVVWELNCARKLFCQYVSQRLLFQDIGEVFWAADKWSSVLAIHFTERLLFQNMFQAAHWPTMQYFPLEGVVQSRQKESLSLAQNLKLSFVHVLATAKKYCLDFVLWNKYYKKANVPGSLLKYISYKFHHHCIRM